MFPISYIKRSDISRAARELKVSIEVIQAVTKVEARGSGFIERTDLPCILFEGHKFSSFTHGVYDHDHPNISHQTWTKENYIGGRGEYDRLTEAIRVNGGDAEPALKSCSWGMFQIMGFNYAEAGFECVQDLVNALSLSEGKQLDAFVNFVKFHDLDDSLRSEDWEHFAESYNGPKYKANAYDVKLASAFSEKIRDSSIFEEGDQLKLERGDAVNLQIALNVAIDAGLVPDGWIGRKTINAIRKLQVREGWKETGNVDQKLCDYVGLDISAYSKGVH